MDWLWLLLVESLIHHRQYLWHGLCQCILSLLLLHHHPFTSPRLWIIAVLPHHLPRRAAAARWARPDLVALGASMNPAVQVLPAPSVVNARSHVVGHLMIVRIPPASEFVVLSLFGYLDWKNVVVCFFSICFLIFNFFFSFWHVKSQCARRSFRCRYLDLKSTRASRGSKRKWQVFVVLVWISWRRGVCYRYRFLNCFLCFLAICPVVSLNASTKNCAISI